MALDCRWHLFVSSVKLTNRSFISIDVNVGYVRVRWH